MRTTSLTVTASGASNWVPLNHFQTPFNVGFGVTKTGDGEMTFSVQHTFHEVLSSANAPANASAMAFDHSEVSGQSASIDGNYAYPVAAIRLLVTEVSGEAQATFEVKQAAF